MISKKNSDKEKAHNMELKFTIYGKPFGKQRPRFSRRGRFTSTYTPKETIDYEQYVKMTCINQMADDDFSGWFNGEPLEVNIVAYYEIPKSTTKKKLALIEEGIELPTKKPDWDNIAKIVCDSINEIAWQDDTQVVCGSVIKRYSSTPRVEVTIKEFKGEKYGI